MSEGGTQRGVRSAREPPLTHLLHAAGGRRALARRLGGQLLAGRLAAGALAAGRDSTGGGVSGCPRPERDTRHHSATRTATRPRVTVCMRRHAPSRLLGTRHSSGEGATGGLQRHVSTDHMSRTLGLATHQTGRTDGRRERRVLNAHCIWDTSLCRAKQPAAGGTAPCVARLLLLLLLISAGSAGTQSRAGQGHV